MQVWFYFLYPLCVSVCECTKHNISFSIKFFFHFHIFCSCRCPSSTFCILPRLDLHLFVVFSFPLWINRNLQSAYYKLYVSWAIYRIYFLSISLNRKFYFFFFFLFFIQILLLKELFPLGLFLTRSNVSFFT